MPYRDSTIATRMRIQNLERQLLELETRAARQAPVAPVTQHLANGSAKIAGLALGALYRLREDAARREHHSALPLREPAEPDPPREALPERARQELISDVVTSERPPAQPSPSDPPETIDVEHPIESFQTAERLDELLDDIGALIEEMDTHVGQPSEDARAKPSPLMPAPAEVTDDLLAMEPLAARTVEDLQLELSEARRLLRQLDPGAGPAVAGTRESPSPVEQQTRPLWTRLRGWFLRLLPGKYEV